MINPYMFAGKTQTISVLIQMLVALKQRVLVTAHTHSAVDTVLSRYTYIVLLVNMAYYKIVCVYSTHLIFIRHFL